MKYSAEQRILIHDTFFKVSVMENMWKQVSQKFSCSALKSNRSVQNSGTER